VLLDVVYNHLGPDGNYLGRYGPYFTDRYRTPWGDAVNLDGAGSDEVRRFVIDNALMWLRDYHVDGSPARRGPRHRRHLGHPLPRGARREVEALAAQLGRPLVLIAESDLNDPRVVRPREAGGYGLDAQWSDDFHHALHAASPASGRLLRGLRSPGRRRARAPARLRLRRALLSVTAARVHGRPSGALPGHRFLGYACRTTTRSATGRAASGWATSSGRASKAWRPRSS
jgi:maltooligosyltrehalose trehalohydrolase